uniref:Protein kinase D3 n=1 Tax=Astyanax mexicanus TaxID=7994 RepID=A0A3B1ITK2_ASTMX
MSTCSSSSPPSFQRAFGLPPHHAAPLGPTPSPSPPGTVLGRLSNGSLSAPSPTNSRGSFHGISFLLQIGLTRETVNLDASDVSLSAVKDLVCSIVDQKLNLLLPGDRVWRHGGLRSGQPCFLLCFPECLSEVTDS